MATGMRTLMPSAANRRRLCCCVSFNVRLLRPLKMIGSTLHGFIRGFRVSESAIGDVRYATTIESRRAIASSATALVRSIVSRTEFFCRRVASKGASSSTAHVLSADSLPEWTPAAYGQCCRNSHPQDLLDIFAPISQILSD